MEYDPTYKQIEITDNISGFKMTVYMKGSNISSDLKSDILKLISEKLNIK